MLSGWCRLPNQDRMPGAAAQFLPLSIIIRSSDKFTVASKSYCRGSLAFHLHLFPFSRGGRNHISLELWHHLVAICISMSSAQCVVRKFFIILKLISFVSEWACLGCLATWTSLASEGTDREARDLSNQEPRPHVDSLRLRSSSWLWGLLQQGCMALESSKEINQGNSRWWTRRWWRWWTEAYLG